METTRLVICHTALEDIRLVSTFLISFQNLLDKTVSIRSLISTFAQRPKPATFIIFHQQGGVEVPLGRPGDLLRHLLLDLPRAGDAGEQLPHRPHSRTFIVYSKLCSRKYFRLIFKEISCFSVERYSHPLEPDNSLYIPILHCAAHMNDPLLSARVRDLID